MQTTNLFSIIFALISIFNIPFASAKCCRADAGGDCGDNSQGTPCCGYNKCNGFCCHCPGVQIIRQEVETTPPGIDPNSPIFVTSVITAPPGTTWTCRADHVTHTNNGRREMPTAISYPAFPLITAPAKFGEDSESDSESDEILMQVSNGTGQVTLEQYLDYFGVGNTNSGESEAGNARKSTVIAMFHERDRDGNGVLTKDEIDLRI